MTRLGRVLSAALAPGYSWCMRCGTAWKFVKERTVWPECEGFPIKGHFALCVQCWDESTEDERVRYHMQAIRQWWTEIDEREVSNIIRAVRRDSTLTSP